MQTLINPIPMIVTTNEDQLEKEQQEEETGEIRIATTNHFF